MTWAVRFEDVSKRYRGGGARYASLRHDLSALIRRLPERLRGVRAAPRGPLALDEVSFEVRDGESFAIIGPNGAGKTTALKIISRITYPTGGRARVRGRVGALIEVGSGVHPELTARENIWLYGQILGMSKAEVRRRFDEIVEFAELGHVLDTPVKMYSSGMQLRLGFSIASHLDPDVFVVDEALAVGDAGFQAKCVERMTKLVGEGRSLLFVSHNLSAVEAICERGIFLLDGRVEAEGDIRHVLVSYTNWVDEGERRRKGAAGAVSGRGLTIEQVTVHGEDGDERYVFSTGEPLEVRLHLSAEQTIRSPWFSIGISDGRPGALILCSMLEKGQAFDIAEGRHTVSCRLAPLPLGPRTYELWMSVREAVGAADLVDWSCVGSIRIKMPDEAAGPGGVTAPWMYGPVRVEHGWSLDEG
ncbi:MAG: ABC transporter ATP-binding protein [Gemmatimonadota bacterium]|nr:MAG: ABC transporter ATP-binding protein [Gemmatimonadota bacterium]